MDGPREPRYFGQEKDSLTVRMLVLGDGMLGSSVWKIRALLPIWLGSFLSVLKGAFATLDD